MISMPEFLLLIVALKFTFSFFSQVVEKTEHADLWLEVMTLSGTEALFDLLTSSNPALQQTVLCAIKNLAAHPKMARLFIDYGLENVTQLLLFKVESCSDDIHLFMKKRGGVKSLAHPRGREREMIYRCS